MAITTQETTPGKDALTDLGDRLVGSDGTLQTNFDTKLNDFLAKPNGTKELMALNTANVAVNSARGTTVGILKSQSNVIENINRSLA